MSVWPFLAALVASTTAIGIAVFVYPWQRNKDRENDVKRERRAAYIEYARSTRRLYFAQPFAGIEVPSREFLTIGELEQSYYIATDAVYLIGSDLVTNEVMEHHRLLREWLIMHSKMLGGEDGVSKEAIREKDALLRAKYNQVMDTFRNDVQSGIDQGISFAMFGNMTQAGRRITSE